MRRYWAIEGKEAVRDLVRCKGITKALVVSEPIVIFYPRDRKS
jgi:hypothetical protein